MIDIKKAEEEFKIYVSKYDLEVLQIKRKFYHTFRVEDLCGKIAISLGMNGEDVEVAKLIGLLHDIARFEQYTKYKTFEDHKSIDHGEFAINILEKDEYIRKYIENDKYDELIKKAIFNHNKYKIESNLSDKEKTFANIIRDADKLDIMYLATCEYWKYDIEDVEKQDISPKVLEQFKKEEILDKRNVQNILDEILVNIAFIFDFNFKENYNIIKENNYINKTIDRFNFKNEETKKQMEQIRKIANNYIDNKIQK